MQFVTGDIISVSDGLQLDFSSLLSNGGGTANLIIGGSLIALLGPDGGGVDLIRTGDATTEVATLIDFQGGSSSTPVLLPGGQLVAEVTGTIGGQGTQDYYTFFWSGGVFSATASMAGKTTSGVAD